MTLAQLMALIGEEAALYKSPEPAVPADPSEWIDFG